ncbi:transglycosylase domain-containing protein [Kitasatospora sp. MMS16-BH015]|uniref:transglycosylase domain-containing protein n=1 Tax=Kitasatospora sp. MMS16-BH015 TaxID=2018025 RepID=UPI00210F53FB|nr:transglycosylase domain-containing protein [Kitasatospora sp. MMS16-BH015]
MSNRHGARWKGPLLPRRPSPRSLPSSPRDRARSTGRAGSTSAAGRRARRRARLARRTGWRRLVPTWRMTLGGLVTAVLLGMTLFGLGIAFVQVPDAHAAAVAQSNTWLYRDGSVLARTGETDRQIVPIDRISPAAREAALAAEDRNFYHEGAVNLKGLARAAFTTATGGGTQGGSTITQQYVKNTYLTQKQTVTRKVQELFISLKVDATKSKDEILAGYLNTSYYGRGAYGIQAAAQAYFGVDAARLDAAQGAYLAALLNAPSAYDVSTATAAGRQNALDRWNHVLDAMVKEGWLPAGDRAAAAFPQVREPQSPPGLSGQAGYLVRAATDYLTSHGIVNEAALAQGGYTVRLTVDPQREQQLETAVKAQLTDRLDPAQRRKDADAQAGAVSVDPSTGEVLALYGGTDATKHWIDNATRRDYQAGSTFKAIALAAALDSGAKTQGGQRITPSTVYDGTSGRPVRGGTGTPYAPPNEGGRSYGPVTLRQATDWSVNSAFAQLAQDTGLEKVRQTAVDLGLPASTPGLTADPAIPLGVSTPSVLDLAGVYATLDHGGRRIEPRLVAEVRHGGEGLRLPQPATTRAVSERTAAEVTDLLRGVVDDPGGTGYRAKELGRPSAGKTGTTDDSRSVWYAGYTPELVTVVGLFGQDPKTGAQVTLDDVGGTGSAAGGRYPAQIWTAYMKAALDGQPVTPFPKAPADPAASSPSPTADPSATGATPSRGPSPSSSATASSPAGTGTGRPATPPAPSATPTGDRPTPTPTPSSSPSSSPPPPPSPSPSPSGSPSPGPSPSGDPDRARG